MVLMLMVVLCYTICSLSDKYAVAKIKFNGNELTFLMAAATALFMTFTLPFVDTRVIWGIPAVAAILLLTASKMLEFQMSALILQDMSAFELKAWLGICLFVSYFTDIVMKTQRFSWLRLGFIAVTVIGLVLIAQAGRKKIRYGKIVLPLIVYLAAKYGYGLVIAAAEPYISSTMCLYFALILLALILLPMAHPVRIFREKRNGGLFVVLTKIPNVAGLLGENAVIAVSLANYSFIQPMILVVLFFWGIARKEEEHDLLSVLGGIVCIVGIVGFQFV
ncbi:MAG: hypothetical protein BHW06_01770 [Clostridium sp. 44_14]|nr:MAG: hypothetical protein BHW06_01770 [Clostridium sp. 44_14]